MSGRPGPAQPWDTDAFPAYCNHCGKTYWYRPGDVIPRHEEPNGECWTKIYAHQSARDPATAWWEAIVRWARTDERMRIAEMVEEPARRGPAGKTRRAIAEEIRNAP